MKYKLWQNRGGEWYWTLVAKNGEPIASSEGYTSEDAARKGIRSVRLCAPIAKVRKV